MRKAAVVAAVVVVALALLAVLLPRVVSLESLKPEILAVLEAKTGRKVFFTRLSLSLFPGIGLKISGLTVPGDARNPGENFLTVPEAEVRMPLLKLLAGRIEFNRFILYRPEVVFRKYRDGTHSATQIANLLAKREKPSPLPPAEKVTVSLNAVLVEEARVHLFQEEEDGKQTRWEIDPFTMRLQGIGRKRNEFEIETRIDGTVRGEVSISGTAVHEDGKVSDPTMFRLSAKGKAFGQSFNVEGAMSAPQGLTEADVTVTFPKFEMDKIPKILGSPPSWMAETSPEGVAVLVAKVSGNLQAMGFEFEADLTRSGWTALLGLRKFIDMPCTVVAQGHRFPDMILVSNAELRFSPLLVIANGSYAPSTGAREWTASARIASLADFARARGGEFSKYAPAGRLTASGKGKRESAKAKDAWQVSMDVGETGFQLPARGMDFRSLNGHVEITPAAVDLQPLAGLFNGQHFSLRGTVSLGKSPSGQVSLMMPYLDADAIFPPDGGKDKKRGEEPPAAEDRNAIRVSARGTVKIDAGKIRGLEFKDLSGVGRYEEGTLFVESLRAGLYGGNAALSGRIRVAPPNPDFLVKVRMDGVSADEILSWKTSLKGFLFGKVALAAEIGGDAKDFADFARSAAGTGSVKVTGGKIKGVDPLSVAAGLAGLRRFLPPSSAGAERGTDGEMTFRDLSADFRVAGGKIRTDAIRIASDDFDMSGTAVLGFDKTFDFRGPLSLSREISKQAQGITGRFLVAPSGRLEIPLVISGPITAPAMAIDTETLARGLVGGAIRGLTDRHSADGAASGAASEKSQEREGTRKTLEGFFRNLLPGRK